MHCLYLSLIDINNQDGYDRKTLGQVGAFQSYGWSTTLVCYRNGSVATGCLGPASDVVAWKAIGEKIQSLVKRRIALFSTAASEMARCKPRLVYIRYPRADLFLAAFLFFARVRWPQVVVVSEIPTYPFDKEQAGAGGVNDLLIRSNEWLFRPAVTAFVTAYSVVAYAGKAFGKHSVRIENGIDRQMLNHQPVNQALSHGINLIFVANFSANNYRHGIDRLLKGCEKYAREAGSDLPIFLHVVGDVTPQEELFRDAVWENGSCRVVLHGRKTFNELKKLYESMHVGIGCLGFHRIGVSHTSALKEREYLSFGLPIVSSSADFSFDGSFPYRLKVPDDDSDIDIRQIINFAKECHADEGIRSKVQEAALLASDWPVAMLNLKTLVEEE